MFRFIVLLLLVCFVVHPTLAFPKFKKGLPAPTVTTPSGRLRGRYVETREGRLVQAYFSIPFAKPPVGPLRFQPPQPIEPWSHERLAVTQPLACAQIVDPTSIEDCLYLNIYTPDASPAHSYPVMVFFYGGGFEIGAAYGYTGEYFLDEDVVFVVVQYRLGLFGFLSTGDEVVPGNMGLKDQRQALRWLQRNVQSFGGDPGRVTIYGQSAGSASVHLLMTYCAHEDLFWAGISESGTALSPWAFHPPEEIRKMVPVLALLSGCPPDSVGLLQCLSSRPQEEILSLYDTFYKGVMYFNVEVITSEFLPLIGGVIEPECVEDRFVTGNPWDYNTTTPWLVGVNSKEVLFVLTAELNERSGSLFVLVNLLFDFYFPLAQNYQNSIANGTFVPLHVREYYLDLLPISRLTVSQIVDGVTDAVFTYGTYEAVMRANKKQTYLYFLDYVNSNELFPIPYDARVGASHADELFFFFPQPASPLYDRQVYTDIEDNEVSRKLVKMWVNFATCRDPTPSEACDVKWEPFFPRENYLNITRLGFFMDHPFLPDRMNFWSNQPFPYRNDTYETPPCTGPYTSGDVTDDSDYLAPEMSEGDFCTATLIKSLSRHISSYQPDLRPSD